MFVRVLATPLKIISYYSDLGAAHMRWLTPISRLAHSGEMIFIPRSYEIFYLTSIKKVVMALEKDCFDHVVFKRF